MTVPILALPTLKSQAVGEPYLKVQLTSQQAALLPMDQAQEAIAIPSSRVTPMPNMPSSLLGLLNHKSRVLWVLDLPEFLGFPHQSLNLQQYNIAIVRVGKMPLGLVVPEIKGVMRFATEAIASPIGEVPSSLTPYLRGCLVQDSETLWVLDPEAILHSPVLSESV